MKIIRLQIEGLRKLSAISFDLNPNGLNIIAGDNEAGKSTVSLAVKSLLEGSGIIPADAVQHGKDKAIIIAKTDDGYTFKEIIKPDGTAIVEVLKDDMKKSSPRTFLNELKGKFFDVRQFVNLSSKEKVNYLKKLMNFTEIDSKIEKVKQERLFIGRDIKNIGIKNEPEKVEYISIKELSKKLQIENELLQKENNKERKINKANEVLKKYKNEKIEIEDKIEKTKIILIQLENDLSKKEQQIITGENHISELPQSDIENINKRIKIITNQIEEAEEINIKAKEYQDYIIWKNNYDKLNVDYTKKDQLYKILEKEKYEMLKKHTPDINGLEITDYGLSLNNITDENWSDSQSLEVAAAIGAKFAGRLRTIIVRNGEAFGKKKLKKFAEFCKNQNIQCIIEIVEDNPNAIKGDNVFFIEDGNLYR